VAYINSLLSQSYFLLLPKTLSKRFATEALNEKMKSLNHLKKIFLLGKHKNALFCSSFVIFIFVKKK